MAQENEAQTPGLTAEQIVRNLPLLISLGTAVIRRRAEQAGATIDDVLNEADKKYKTADTEIEELLKSGHTDPI